MLFHRGDGVLRKREKQRVNSCDLLSEKIYHFPNGLKIINYYICFFGDCFNLRTAILPAANPPPKEITPPLIQARVAFVAATPLSSAIATPPA